MGRHKNKSRHHERTKKGGWATGTKGPTAEVRQKRPVLHRNAVAVRF
jgi:hypothetical protein